MITFESPFIYTREHDGRMLCVFIQVNVMKVIAVSIKGVVTRKLGSLVDGRIQLYMTSHGHGLQHVHFLLIAVAVAQGWITVC